MIDKTTILRHLSTQEIRDLKSELALIDSKWVDHHKPTALLDGKTVYLNLCTDRLTAIENLFDLVPLTKKILDRVVQPYHLGKCYWHRLMPGERIMLHNDSMVDFVKNKKLEHRYQIYLDCDKDIQIILDREIKSSQEYSNTLVDFDLTKLHGYKNLSNQPWYLLVFDAINQPLKNWYQIQDLNL